MCGIFGYSGKRPVDIIKLRWLAVENQSRGSDSTGIYGNHLFKEKMRSKDFILTSGFNAAAKGANTIQGHTRSASYGFAVTRDNAHPFTFGIGEDWEVVGAHNGFIIPDMLKYHTEALGFEKEFSVDSMLIFAALHKYKGDPNILSEIEGAMALSFMFPRHNPDLLYLYRRQNTRDLHMGQASDGIYYSSEAYPLDYIGCNNIWTAEPNILYTLEKGKIVDYCKIKEPVLKKLAANVKRHDWRQGVPSAQMSALPINVTTPNQSHASKSCSNLANWNSKKDNKQMGLNLPEKGGGGTGTLRRMAEEQESDNLRDYITNSYSTKDSETKIKARFQLLIKNFQKEISNMGAEVITDFTQTSRMGNSDYGSCIIAIQLKNKSNQKGLSAWSILMENNVDVAGLTTPNGFTCLTVPSALCGKEITLHAYSPVDQMGNYTFKIKPEAGRVMEVALEIPFRKERDEAKTTTNTDDCIDTLPDRCGVGSDVGAKNVPVIDGTGSNGADKTDNIRVLRPESGPLSGGSKGIQANGKQIDEGDTNGFISEGKHITCLDKAPVLIPTHVDPKKRDELIEFLISIDGTGNYSSSWTPKAEIVERFVNSPYFNKWVNVYSHDRYKKCLDKQTLLHDAIRLQVWDKQTHKAYYILDFYIEILLRTMSHIYVDAEYCDSHPYFMVASLYPSNINKVLDKEKNKVASPHFTEVSKKKL